jgi:hypothetical protein
MNADADADGASDECFGNHRRAFPAWRIIVWHDNHLAPAKRLCELRKPWRFCSSGVRGRDESM